jgi:hypothetical protein
VKPNEVDSSATNTAIDCNHIPDRAECAIVLARFLHLQASGEKKFGDFCLNRRFSEIKQSGVDRRSEPSEHCRDLNSITTDATELFAERLHRREFHSNPPIRRSTREEAWFDDAQPFGTVGTLIIYLPTLQNFSEYCIDFDLRRIPPIRCRAFRQEIALIEQYRDGKRICRYAA